MKYAIAFLVMLLALAACTAQIDESEPHAHDHGTAHDVVNVDAQSAPTLDISVTPDARSGYNLKIESSNVDIVPQTPDITDVDGQGHYHVYIDGTKIGRFYTNEIFLGDLDEGMHEIEVTISNNLHSEFAIDGKIIKAYQAVSATSIEPAHAHPASEVDAQNPPSVQLTATPDPVKGWNLVLELQNFILSSEGVSEEAIAGQGHAHLYIDDVRYTRLYAPNYHLGDLPPGEHVITVTLSDNLHNELTLNDEVIGDSITLTGKEDGKAPFAAYASARSGQDHMAMDSHDHSDSMNG